MALAFGVGIALAHHLPFPEILPLGGALVVLVVCGAMIVCRGTPPTRSLLLAAVFVGAARYDLGRPADGDPNQLRLGDERRLVRLRGTIARPPISNPADEPSPLRPTHRPTTRIRIQLEGRFSDIDGWSTVTGLIDCSLPTADSPLKRGDRVEVFGWLSAPHPPMNDGEFDYAERLRRQGVLGVLLVEAADGALLLEAGSPWTLLRIRDGLLESCRDRLQRWMPRKEAGVAEAAVLGARTSMRREDVEPWVNSGTLHMLVVSGWHVAVVAGAAWWFSRFLMRSRRRRAVLAIAAIWAYTLLTGGEGPAVRAAVFTSMLLVGVTLGRPIQPLNSLAAGALILLVADPHQLFHTGAQLSVLAVMGLLLLPQRLVAPLPAIDPDLGQPHGWRTRWRHGLMTAFVASACATAATAPLVGHQFHLFSPASVWLSVILAPVLVAAIACSVLVMLFADLPFAAAPFGKAAEWSLQALTGVVERSEWLPGGFYFCSGPPLWWTGILLTVVWLPFVVRPRWSAGWRHSMAVVLWSIVGVFSWALPSDPGTASFHQLAVGHGNAALLQSSDGKTCLIDCGSMTVPTVGERIIAPFLWRRGIQTIDAVFLSHADVDHFNGLPALLTRFRIGVVYAPPQFARMEQKAVQVAADALHRQGVPLRFVWAEDRLRVGDVEIEVLWPTPTARGRSDNSNSLVLDLSCRGRRVLSTGDLAEEGLQAVLRTDRPAVDVLVIPHHGGRSCNPPELAEWADATAAVGSQHGKAGDSMAVYRAVGTIDLRTDVDGALSVEWRKDDLTLTTHSTRRWIRACR
jgi:competence protein ComEC